VRGLISVTLGQNCEGARATAIATTTGPRLANFGTIGPTLRLSMNL
jgi:hypothetical protein